MACNTMFPVFALVFAVSAAPPFALAENGPSSEPRVADATSGPGGDVTLPPAPAEKEAEAPETATETEGAADLFAEPPAHDEDITPLTGNEIYRKVLDNRFNSYQQNLVMESGDRSGNTDRVEMSVKYMSTRESSKRVLSKSIAKYHAPMDVRHMGYLVINKAEGVDDQFVYMPSTRRVRRINLRGESIVGTDFSLEDIIPREFEDATYVRLPNETVEGVACYVVEVTPHEETNSEYSKFVASIDKETFVPIKNIYWDDKGVKMKELVISPESITRFEDEDKSGPRIVWVALHSRVDNLKLYTYTTLDIEELKANPGLSKRHFSERNLTAGR